MNNNETQPLQRSYHFVLLIIGSIITALLLVFVSLSLYRSSGTAQIDLSRPDYAAAREKINNDNYGFKGFDPSGPLDQKALSEFDMLYAKKLKEATSVDAFNGDVLSPQALRIDNTSTNPAEQ